MYFLAAREGKQIAFEIETGKSDAAANIQKCLSAGIQRIVVVPTSTQAYRKVRTRLIYAPNVEVITAQAVLKQTW